MYYINIFILNFLFVVFEAKHFYNYNYNIVLSVFYTKSKKLNYLVKCKYFRDLPPKRNSI